MSQKKTFDLRSYIQRNVRAVQYAGVILSAFFLLIIITIVNWGSIFNVGATDNCVADLQKGTGGESIVIGSGTITINVGLTLDADDYANGVINCSETDITVNNGATVTLQGYDDGDGDWEDDYGVTWNVKSLDVESSATISAVGQGYTSGRGPGSGGNGSGFSGGGGGAYGGAGGQGAPDLTNPAGVGGSVYGHITDPVDMGSGGGLAGTGGIGGAGGGFIKIQTADSSGSVTINGSILADGATPEVSSDSAGGAGSGGTIIIEAGTLIGTGVVSADGGDSAETSREGGGGGGGRVVMYSTVSNEFVVNASCEEYPESCNVRAYYGSGYQNGGGGTVIGPTCYPESPIALVQRAYEVVGEWQYIDLNVGDSTRSSQMQFEMLVSDLDTTDILYPQVEIQEVGTSFTGVPTKTGVGVGFVKTEGAVVAQVVVENIDLSKQYHWQARVKDEQDAVSDWVSFGENVEAGIDFIISGVPALLVKGSGDNQTATVGSQLPNPLVVSVTDSGGLPVYGYDVDWGVLQGGGSVLPISGVTDRSGFISTDFTLGLSSGSNNNIARAIRSGLSGVPTFTASASSDQADYYEVVTPQAALTGQSFEITVNARDQYDNLVTASNVVSIAAVTSADIGVPGSGSLLPTGVTLVDGTVTVSTVTYSVQESIKIKAEDVTEIVGYSNAVAIVDSYGSCPDADGVIDVNQLWEATPANAGIFDCRGLNIVVEPGKILTLQSHNDGDEDYTEDFGVTLLTDNLTVNEGSKITATGLGYGMKEGPGTTSVRSTGAGHGGYGGGSNGADALPYGDVYEPITLGSGAYEDSYGEGGTGGGAMKFVVGGVLTLNGGIESDGTAGTDATIKFGGGSGGSIWIDTATMAGTGSVRTNGGAGGANGGSGGRIAIYYNTDSGFGLTNPDLDKIQSRGHTSSIDGGPGTIYVERKGVEASHKARLYVDNDTETSTTLAALSEGTYEFSKIVLTKGGGLEVIGDGSELRLSSGTGIVGDATISELKVSGTFNYTGTGTLYVNGVDLGFNGAVLGVEDLTIGNVNEAGVTLYAHTWANNTGEYTFGDVLLTNGTVALQSHNDGDEDYTEDFGVTLLTDNLTVNEGSKITATGLGYGMKEGPGTTSVRSTGAGHGGYGGGSNGADALPYGDVYEPITLGSGAYEDSYGEGGTGGGAMKFVVGGVLTLNGGIESDGTAGTDATIKFGGGSGGSIWIDTATMAGTGSVRTNGGAGGANGGSGGRIAIYYNTDSGFGLTNPDLDKIQSRGHTSSIDGGPGTIYVERKGVEASHKARLYVDNDTETSTTLAALSEGTYEFSKIVLTKRGGLEVIGDGSELRLSSGTGIVGDATISELKVSGTFNYTGTGTLYVNGVDLGFNGAVLGVEDLTIGNVNEAGVTLYAHTWANNTGEYTFGDVLLTNGTVALQSHNDGDEDYTEDFGVTLLTDNLTVNEGSKITATGLGYGMKEGPGTTSVRSTGAGHGGYGGGSNGADALPYGDVYEPITLGSGAYEDSYGEGGTGGGAMKFVVGGVLTLNGGIESDGTAGTDATIKFGGGSGGSIWIDTATMAGTGSVRTNGGAGGANGGSGGRIAIYYNTDSGFGLTNPDLDKIQSRGHTSSIDGGPGTIYVERKGVEASHKARLYVDNDTETSTTLAALSEGTYEFSKIVLTKRGGLEVIGDGSELRLSSGTGIVGDATISELKVSGTFNYTGTGTLYVNGVDLGFNGAVLGVEDLTIGNVNEAGVTLYAHTWANNTGEYTFGDVLLTNGTVALQSHNDGDEDYTEDFGVTLLTDNLTVNEGSKITATGLGYGMDEGLGTSSVGNAGAGHGGYGGGPELDALPYGDVYEPITLGSGAMNYGSYGHGGAGGGAMKFVVGGVLTLNGEMENDGLPGSGMNCGGGSGGSIWIDTATMAGTGSMRTNGGEGSGNGGAGGRIAIYYGTDGGFGLTNPDLDKIQSRGHTSGIDGGPGTIYVEQKGVEVSHKARLYVDNDTETSTTLAALSEGTYEFSKIVLTKRGGLEVIGDGSELRLSSGTGIVGDATISELKVGGTFYYTGTGTLYVNGVDLGFNGAVLGVEDLTIGNVNEAGVTLYAHTWANNTGEYTFGDVQVTNGTVALQSHNDGDEDYTEDFGVTLLTDNLTVNEGSKITATGLGYGMDEGLGTSSVGNAGAGHGGYGGGPELDALPYGDVYEPITLGSGAMNYGSYGHGGAGGGAMKFVVGGVLTLNGEMENDGLPGSGMNCGGGSGGSIWIDTATMAGTGSMRTNGGEGSGNGGAGGRIAIYYGTDGGFGLTNPDLDKIQSRGHTSGIDGGPGTIYVEQKGENEELIGTLGSLYINNHGAAGSRGMDFPAAWYKFRDVYIGENVTIRILGNTSLNSGVVLYLSGDFTLLEGASLDGAGNGFPSGSGPGVGADGSIALGGEGSGGGGGAYGGDGGSGQDDGANGVTSGGLGYGNSVEPLLLGSGGGVSGAGASGGAAGSAFAVYALEGDILVDGSITMDGMPGLTSSPGGGGGAGGSILLKGSNLVLGASSVLTVDGGYGGDDIAFDGGGGGGGRISALFGNSFLSSGTTSYEGGTGYQTGQEGTELGPIGYPKTPESMDQVDLSLSEPIPVGGTTDATTVSLEFIASDADSVDVLTPEVEILPVGENFTGVANFTGEAVNYSGTPLDVDVTATGLVLGVAYHWQARVVDDSGVFSNWLTFGDNNETDADFIVTKATKLILTSSVATINAGGYLTLNVSAQDDDGRVDTSFRDVVDIASTDTRAVLPSNYTFLVSDAGEHTFTNGVRMMSEGVQTITVFDVTDSSIESDTTTVTVLQAPDQVNASVTVEPEQIENNGEDSSTVVVTLTDDFDNPVIGTLVTLNATGTGNNLIQPTEATDENGQAFGSITSTVIGDKTVTVLIDGVTQSCTTVLEVRDRISPSIVVDITDITQTSATVSWETNENTTGQVQYGTTYLYGKTTAYDDILEVVHVSQLTELIPATEYHVQVLARDESSNEILSTDKTFTTKPSLIDIDNSETEVTPEIDSVTPPFPDANCGIYGVNHERSSEPYLDISWATTCDDMVCSIDYGKTTVYGDTVENVSSIIGRNYKHSLDISALDDLEIHYRITCFAGNDKYQTIDYLYQYVPFLPITGDEESESSLVALLDNIATFVVPSLTGLSLLLQLLNFLAKLGQIPKLGKLFGAIFDKERKNHGWGIVFDIDKNVPIPFAVVRLYKAEGGAMVDEVVSDLEGRYRFLSEEGKYTIGVEHTDYVLPETKKELAKNYDLTNKYLGGEIEIKGDFAVAYDIPLLPKTLAEKDNRYQSLKDSFKVFMDKFGFWLNIIGGTLLIFALIFSPTIVNFILLGINIAIIGIVFYLNNVLSKNWGYVFLSPAGKRLPGIFVRLFDAKENKLINTQITDDKGRYGFLAEEGEYAMIIESPYYKQDKELLFSVQKGEKLMKKNIGVKKVKDAPEDAEAFDTPFGRGGEGKKRKGTQKPESFDTPFGRGADEDKKKTRSKPKKRRFSKVDPKDSTKSVSQKVKPEKDKVETPKKTKKKKPLKKKKRMKSKTAKGVKQKMDTPFGA